MDAQQIEDFRRILDDLRAELKATLDADAEETKPVEPDRAIGRLTRQDAIQSQQMALELRRRKQGRLAQVERGLARIGDGSFGICVRCEEEISEVRLKVRPETPMCIACAENRSRI